MLAVLLVIYLFLVCIKQGFAHRGELRAVWFVMGLMALPLLTIIHFQAHWDFSHTSDFMQPNHWWIIPVRAVGDADPAYCNLIVAGLILAGLYMAASGLVSVFAWYYRIKRKARLLAIHRVIIKLVVVLLGLLIYLKSENISLTPIWVGMGAASIVLGIALQEPLSSLFSGVALDMEGVFKPGEWIRVGGKDGLVGKVVEKNWRTSKIMTLDDELITIPNRLLGSETLLNFNQPEKAHVHRIQVGTSYNDPPVKVKEVLRTIMIRESRILKDPPPVVRTTGYNDFSIDYELKFWLRDYAEHPSVCDTVRTHIWYAFKFYGIEIPFPIRTVHMKEQEQLNEEAREIGEGVKDLKTFLRTLPVFQEHLVYKDFDFLAQNSFQRIYSPGEHVVHKGEMGAALYVVRDGHCLVLLPSGEERRIESGNYFGEMGLLKLKARTANVVAGEGGSTLIRIDRECMQILFDRYPALWDSFEAVRTERMIDAGMEIGESGPERVPVLVNLIKAVKDLILPW